MLFISRAALLCDSTSSIGFGRGHQRHIDALAARNLDVIERLTFLVVTPDGVVEALEVGGVLARVEELTQ